MKKSMGLGGSVVSKNIINGKGSLKWCMREQPLNEVDNGWRFLSDMDTDEFLSDSSNMAVYDWGTLVEIEPAIMALLDMPIGADVTLVEKDGRKFFVDSNTGERI